MSFSVDSFMDRVPTSTYNCLDFAREVWKALCGEDIADHFPKLQGPFSLRRASPSGLKRFRRIRHPESPCFVVFQTANEVPHIGIFIDGQVLHLHTSGAEFQPLNVARRYFKDTRYFK